MHYAAALLHPILISIIKRIEEGRVLLQGALPPSLLDGWRHLAAPSALPGDDGNCGVMFPPHARKFIGGGKVTRGLFIQN